MISFTKMHGLGNDYIYIDRLNDKNIIAEEKVPEFTRYMSNRHFGVGGDGVIFIDNSKVADFKMRVFNQDGSEAEMCGNGIRCFAKYVYDNKITTKTNIAIETLAGIKYAYLVDIKDDEVQEIKVCMGEPKLLTNIELKVENASFDIACVSMGNPHAVIIVNDVEKFDVEKYGPLIENNKVFPNKTNVEFAQIIDKSNIKMRVWERGAGETFACGTGACAVAVACNKKELTRKEVNLSLKGGELKINWDKKENLVYMTGIATKVFDGKIN